MDPRPFGRLVDVGKGPEGPGRELRFEHGRVEVSAPRPGCLRLRAIPAGCTRLHLDAAVFPGEPGELAEVSEAMVAVEPLTVGHDDLGALHVRSAAPGEGTVELFTLQGLASRPPSWPGHGAAEQPAPGSLPAAPSAFVEGTSATLVVGPRDPFYGLGEETGPMNRRARVVTTWNSDTWPHTPSPTRSLYASHPFFISRREVEGPAGEIVGAVWYGVLCDNPARARFDMGSTCPDEVRLEVEAGDLDLYILAGPTPQDVVRRLAWLTGTLEMPPRWMLGFQQSRWSYYPASRVLEVARSFREHQIPCDVLYIDIHYLDAYRAFTWHPERFPDPKALVDELHALDFKVVVILNSAVAVDPSFPVFAAGREGGYFLTAGDGSIYQAEMWPGQAAFPDFTRREVRAWWAGLHAELLALGVDGVWNDMNEPAIFLDDTKTFPESLMHGCDGEPRPHLEVHNVYGMLMDQATLQGIRTAAPVRRVPLMTRAGYTGVQRYAFQWTGDNSSWWEHLPMSIAQVANLGVCGMPFCGPDIGGFNDDCSPELFGRWMQMGLLFPYARAHTAQGTRDQEPWSFGDEVADISREAVRLRYRLLPYLYTLVADMVRHGDPMLRPLYYEYPDDPRALEADDQLMVGSSLLVAPIMAQGRSYRAVYLPEGWWYAWWTGTWHEGGQIVVARAGLHELPLYLKGGSVIPTDPEPRQSVIDGPCQRLRWLLLAPPSDEPVAAHGWLYEDDGVSHPAGRARVGYSETHVSGWVSASACELRLEARRGPFDPGSRQLELAVVRGAGEPEVMLQWGDDGAERVLHLDFPPLDPKPAS